MRHYRDDAETTPFCCPQQIECAEEDVGRPPPSETMATLHLISGLPCSGKSTYALGLQSRLNAVTFSLDRWLISAFGRYGISTVGRDEHTRRVLACRELIWLAASELLRRGADVILDDGFFLREHRIMHVTLATNLGAACRIHFLDTPAGEIEMRLVSRNAHLPEFNFFIDPVTLVDFEQLFERPANDEGADLVVVSPSRREVESLS